VSLIKGNSSNVWKPGGEPTTHSKVNSYFDSVFSSKTQGLTGQVSKLVNTATSAHNISNTIKRTSDLTKEYE
jgi:hypothetical protein